MILGVSGLVWFVLCFVAGSIGSKRKVGYATPFILSLLFTPIVGLIVALSSDKKQFTKPLNSRFISLVRKGDNLFVKDKNFNEAIEKYTEALKYADVAPKTNFKLAKLYSINGDTEKSFDYLVTAISEGYDNYERINKDVELNNLRETKKFKAFVTNRYKLPTPQVTNDKSISKVDELDKLHSLLERGVINQKEFDVEKENILNRQA